MPADDLVARVRLTVDDAASAMTFYLPLLPGARQVGGSPAHQYARRDQARGQRDDEAGAGDRGHRPPRHHGTTAPRHHDEYFRPGRTVDDLFRDCLEVVIAGAAVKAGATP
ncbi:hypothetical protein GCM10010399_22140 [Dactylosporangium fulvum]|uniref:Uncharacterized protein n=1 Tax=Dactylosporangium fulvum TaxID=53359 RepID=A0ABY5W6U2_9ACTN|nr:hypothetical protein [Dactylosporangium fulvum]UWP85607.1 hypothetical protein Dfulv_15730 [Dactylosporangium fulvum]